ncbi:MAG: 3-hydroxy-3-methylglutaryl-CoA reductase, partial [Halobacteriaceae archaeon]
EQLITRIQEGDLKLYELEEEYDADVATMARRKFIASATDTDFSAIEDYSFPANQASANIENMIGATQVPIGVAGPLCIQSGNSVSEYYLPLSTTEGALVASVNRGCAIIDQAGGVSATVFKNGMTRAPVFRVKNVIEAKAVVDWIEDNYQKLQQAAESTTNHGELTDISPYIVGDSVFVRFIYDTKDAMGMNMATIAT